MLKWLTIIVLVTLVFFLIMLGLGALLHDNEKRVVAIKTQIAESKTQLEPSLVEPSTSTSPNDSSNKSLSKNLSNNHQHLTTPKVRQFSVNKSIIAKNLTCVNDEQCHVVNVSFADLTCQLAINAIGKAQLQKAPVDTSKINRCPVYQQAAQAVCRNNLCSLQTSG